MVTAMVFVLATHSFFLTTWSRVVNLKRKRGGSAVRAWQFTNVKMRRLVKAVWRSWSRRGTGDCPAPTNAIRSKVSSPPLPGRAMSGRTIASAEEEAAWMQAFSR